MSPMKVSVFTKPWKDVPLTELCKFVKGAGFDGVELCVRPGFHLEPERAERGLPEVAAHLKDYGLEIYSVAAPLDEAVFAGCAAAGIGVVRTMADIGDDGYLASVRRHQQLYADLLPLTEKYRVTIGVQNHCDKYVCNAAGLLHLIERFDPAHVGAIWDCAHNGLQGEEPEMAIDMLWSRLSMVNFKNAFWMRANGPEAEHPEWKHYFTTGNQGLASWKRVAAELNRRKYEGIVCMTAEYEDQGNVNTYIQQDIRYLKRLLAGEAEA